jgi:hypothetical protein
MIRVVNLEAGGACKSLTDETAGVHNGCTISYDTVLASIARLVDKDTTVSALTPTCCEKDLI